MPAEALAVAATRSYQRRLGRLATVSGRGLARLWDGLPGYDEGDIPAWLERSAGLVSATSAQATAMASGYMQVMLDDHRVAAGPRLPEAVDLRAPFLRHWHLLSTGVQWMDAVSSGRDQADVLGSDLTHRTARAATQELGGDRIVGWRRVPSTNACAWCSLVASQRYHSEESADFGHAGCSCTVTPIVGSVDPGRVLNQ